MELLGFVKIMIVLSGGIGLGWLYCKHFVVKSLRAENKALRQIEITEISSLNGTISARYSEWPLSAEEYFEDVIAQESFSGVLTQERFIHHLNTFASHLTGRQKRDFMKMLKASRSTDEILHSIKV